MAALIPDADLVLDLRELNPDAGTGGRPFAADGRMAFIRVLAGDFTMGARGFYDDEEPPHRVSLTRDFFLGVYPVTNSQFATWPERPEGWAPNEADEPAVRVSWLDARGLCRWLSQHPKMPWGHHTDLPTDAQWEFACRGGLERTEYHGGDGEAALDEIGWYIGNSRGSTHPVGEKTPNPWGFFDMHGNVDEWCRDAWSAQAYRRRASDTRDPFVDSTDQDAHRVLRAGSWGIQSSACRAACRGWRRPGDRFRFLGFRVGLFPDLAQATEKASGEAP